MYKSLMVVGVILSMIIVGASAQEEASAPQAAGAPAVVGQIVQPGLKVKLPLVVYGNCEDEGEQYFIPSGWMGSYDSIELDDCWKENPRSGESCIKISFSDPRGWGVSPGRIRLTIGAMKKEALT